MKWEKFGPLQAVVRPCVDPEAVVVLCHGYGADAKDLVSLADYVAPDKDIYWVFPEAPLDISFQLGTSGRAWFEVDIKALEVAMMQGQHRDLSELRPNLMDEAQEQLAEMIEAMPFSHNEIVVGGFSQGAMITTDYTFQNSLKPKGLVTLSGALVDRVQWAQWAKTCQGLPYFQSHGVNDAVLSLSGAHQLHKLYKENGMKGKFHEFTGGHEIPLPVLTKLSEFIESLCTQ